MTNTQALPANRPRFALLALCASLAVPAFAQTAPPASTPPDQNSTVAAATPPVHEQSQIVQLDPFEVKTDKDTSYGALNSNSITHFNMELSKTPVVADILNQKLIKDTGVTTLDALFRGYANGAGMVFATPESDSTALQPGARFSTSQFSTRSLSAGSPHRDGFQSFNSTNVTTTSLFDIDRVDIVHGSQGLLYGASGAGGVINVVTKQAAFSTDGTPYFTNLGPVEGYKVMGVTESMELENQIDQYGSQLGNVDLNLGTPKAAFRFDGLQQNQQTRYLYVGSTLSAYFGAAAFKLPFNTTLRLVDEETHSKAISTNNTNVNFGGAGNDPRSGDNLLYLYATNQLGAVNPYTGAPYPGGAIDNGHVNPGDALSWSGAADEEDQDNSMAELTLDSVWTKWFSTSIGIVYTKSQEMRNTNLGNLTTPPLNGKAQNANPLNDWAISTTWANSENPGRTKEYRFAGLFTNDLFNGIAKSQSSIGFDRQYNDSSGGIAYQYYLANPDGSVSFDPTKTNGGRTQIPTAWWAVDNGPVQYSLNKMGGKTVMWNGQLWARQVSNPRSPAWVTPNNPLGLASLYAASLNHSTTNTNGISGGNSGDFNNQGKNQGYYIANYTGWWDDAFDTLLGMRVSNAFTRNANTNAATASPYLETRTKNFLSYNAGVDFKIPRLSWLRGYVAYSKNFNTSIGSNDPYGDVPLNPIGYTYEAGLKFDSPNGAISGSLSAYTGYSENDNYNAGTTFRDTVNPTGVSGISFTGPGGNAKNQWAQYDKTSSGLELILTANPTNDWRVRFSADVANGTVQTTSKYAMLYNDQFNTDGKGNVTYANGQPFLVPTDAATLAKVLALSTNVDPTTYGVPLTPLTLAMINTPSSPYYAFGQNTLPQNQPINGSIGNPIGGTLGPQYLKSVLSHFTNAGSFAYTGAVGLPFSAMQYNFADPAGLGGSYTVQNQGNRVVGAPAVQLSVTNDYVFSHGPLKGFGLGAAVNYALYNSQFYYRTADNVQHLFSGPLAPDQTVNTWLSYTRKFRSVTWTTQLNINNMFNHYLIAINPSVTTGYANPANVGTTYYGVPRGYQWTNTLDF